VGRHQEHGEHPLLLGRHEFLDDLEVEDGVLGGDGDELLHLEAEGVVQLLPLHVGQLDGPHDDLLVGDAQDDPPALDARAGPQVPDQVGEGLRVLDLAVADDALGQVDDAQVGEDGLPPVDLDLRDLGRAAADVQPDRRRLLLRTHRHPPLAAPLTTPW